MDALLSHLRVPPSSKGIHILSWQISLELQSIWLPARIVFPFAFASFPPLISFYVSSLGDLVGTEQVVPFVTLLSSSLVDSSFPCIVRSWCKWVCASFLESCADMDAIFPIFWIPLFLNLVQILMPFSLFFGFRYSGFIFLVWCFQLWSDDLAVFQPFFHLISIVILGVHVLKYPYPTLTIPMLINICLIHVLYLREQYSYLHSPLLDVCFHSPLFQAALCV